jgi:hypothetical protein
MPEVAEPTPELVEGEVGAEGRPGDWDEVVTR